MKLAAKYLKQTNQIFQRVPRVIPATESEGNSTTKILLRILKGT